jgi:bifunctional non-homologous end joining protein LigD
VALEPRRVVKASSPKTAAKRASRVSRPARAAPAPARAEQVLGGLKLRITHPDKPYWPDDGYTKLDLLRFYVEAFDLYRPYVKDRLLSFRRCPDGMLGHCFFQKEKPAGMPPDTPTKRIQHVQKSTNYVVGGRLETHLAAAAMGCIAIHVWNSRIADPRKPDWICFDLDPDSGRFADAARAALRLKSALDALDLVSFPKTSGGKGLHVFVPIRVGPDTDEVRGFAERLGSRLSEAYPKELTMEGRIANRKGRVYLDPFRNGFGQTVAAPYSVRRKAKAPFSMPLSWDEVKPDIDPTSFNLGSAERVLRRPDPWKDFWKTRQSTARAFQAVEKL